MKPAKPSILCLDENKDNLELLRFTFERESFNVTVCQTLENCLFEVRRSEFSAIILDNRHGSGASLDACREIKSFAPETAIVFCSGEARSAEIERAIEAGADRYFVKPVDFDQLAETVKNLIRETV